MEACAQSITTSFASCGLQGAVKGCAINKKKVGGSSIVKVSQPKFAHTSSARGAVLRVQASVEHNETSRREMITGAAALLAASSASPALAAGGVPNGFQVYQDNLKGYKFLYPLGWQEVAVQGTEVVFKDVIEPLESVSVTIVPTETASIKDVGTPQQVAVTLIEQVLTTKTQVPQLLSADEREFDGKTYYSFEFSSRAANYNRITSCTVTIAGGKFYTITSGANERRWNKLQKKVETVTKSFTVLY